MSADAAFEQLRRANPEPNPATLRQQLHHAANPVPPVSVTRSNEMETQTIVQNQKPLRSPRKWLPAIASGAVVLLAGIVFVVLSRDGGLFASPTPLQVAQSYMEARNAWDADAARSLLADDVSMIDSPIITIDGFGPEFEVLRVYEFQYEPFECIEYTEIVKCTYLMTSNLQDIVGYPPIPGSFELAIEDGQIVLLHHLFNYNEFGTNVYDPFLTWLESAHPGSFDQLFRIEGAVATPRTTPEALELARTYVAEYDESLNG